MSMFYYHINPETLHTVTGWPHTMSDAYIRQITGCGNPELLLDENDCIELADGTRIVPRIEPPLGKGCVYTEAYTIYADQVVMEQTQLPIETRRDLVWKAIMAERDRQVEDGGWLYDGNWYFSKENVRSQLITLSTKALLGIPFEHGMTTMSGVEVILTPGIVLGIAASAEATETLRFDIAKEKKAAMEALADPEDYDGIYTGWPAAYGG